MPTSRAPMASTRATLFGLASIPEPEGIGNRTISPKFIELRARELELLNHFWPIPRVDTILEIGGGTLIHATFLAPYCNKYVTIDLPDTHSMDAVSRLRIPSLCEVGNITLLLAQGEAIPLHDASVDIVFSSNVFEHLFNKQATVNEITRVLRRGGYHVAVIGIPWTRLNYFVEHVLTLPVIIAGKGLRFLGKRIPTTKSVTTYGTTAVRYIPPKQNAWVQGLDTLRFRTHGEHYHSLWEEVMDYRLSVHHRLHDPERWQLSRVFTNRMTCEWFGPQLNLAVYRMSTPLNRVVGDKWPFYMLGHEAVVVYQRR